jgi:predicted dehydrogenase
MSSGQLQHISADDGQDTTAPSPFTRREFLKGGSFATLMSMLGGVDLFAQTNAPPAEETKHVGPKVKVAVIGLGAWGREILHMLGRAPQADVAAICDHYPAAMKRSAEFAPAAVRNGDFQAVLDNKDIPAVIIATPTHLHKDIVLTALKAGKHVYCEAPLAHTIEDARAIALAARDARELVFQAGLQMRADPQRHFLVPFIRTGALGTPVLARTQWRKKQSWRFPAPTSEREKELNWRLDKAISLGLVGELCIHQLDQACWFLNAHPRAVTGVGSVSFYKDDGREVPDTIQATFEFPGPVFLSCDATLVNSFEGDYEVFCGSESAIWLRDNKAWWFKETDSKLLGWEIYAHKDQFFHETGIALVMDASKSAPAGSAKAPEPEPVSSPLLLSALQVFLRNVSFMLTEKGAFIENYGADDAAGLSQHLAEAQKQKKPAAGYLEGYQAAVTVIKANEAIKSGQRLELKPEWYELS